MLLLRNDNIYKVPVTLFVMLKIQVRKLDPRNPPSWVDLVRRELEQGTEVYAEKSLLNLLREMNVNAKVLDKNSWDQLGDSTVIIPLGFDPRQREIHEYFS